MLIQFFFCNEFRGFNFFSVFNNKVEREFLFIIICDWGIFKLKKNGKFVINLFI